MPYRAWLLIAALGFLICEPAYPQQLVEPDEEAQFEGGGNDQEGQPGTDQEAETELNAPLDFIPAIQGVESAIHDLIAEQRRQASQDASENEIRDLKAQEDMAWWAKLMFYAALASVAVTAVGIVLIGYTLHHTKRAANYAEDMAIQAAVATKAAQDSVEITKTALISIERPFIAVSAIEFPAKTPRGDFVPLRFHYTNYGRTPAILQRAYHKVVLTSDPNVGPEPLIPAERHGRTIPNGEIVGPSGERSDPHLVGPIIKWGSEPPKEGKLYQKIGGKAVLIKKGTIPTQTVPPEHLSGIFEKPTFFIGYIIYSAMVGGMYIRGFCFVREGEKFRLYGGGESNNKYNYDKPFEGFVATPTDQCR